MSEQQPQASTPPAVTVLGIELATREDITLSQRANASLIGALRADLRDMDARVSQRLDGIEGQLSAILAALTKR